MNDINEHLRGQGDFPVFGAAANRCDHPAHRYPLTAAETKALPPDPGPYGRVAPTVVGESELHAMGEVTFEIAFKLSRKSRAIEHSVRLVIDAEAADVDVC